MSDNPTGYDDGNPNPDAEDTKLGGKPTEKPASRKPVPLNTPAGNGGAATVRKTPTIPPGLRPGAGPYADIGGRPSAKTPDMVIEELSAMDFNMLPTVEALRTRWIAEGKATKDDPVFLLMEAMALYHGHQCKLANAQAQLYRLDKEERAAMRVQLIKTEGACDKLATTAANCNENMTLVVDVAGSLAENLPETTETIAAASATISERGWRVTATWISALAAAVVVGLIVGLWVRGR